MSQIEVDYDKLALAMKKHGVKVDNGPQLSMGTKLGIALGGMTASACYFTKQVPIVGHAVQFVEDVGGGAKMGYAVKMEQIRLEEDRKRAEATRAANAIVAPA